MKNLLIIGHLVLLLLLLNTVEAQISSMFQVFIQAASDHKKEMEVWKRCKKDDDSTIIRRKEVEECGTKGKIVWS